MKRLLSGAAVVCAASIFGLTYGLSAPLIAEDLAGRGSTTLVIGANAAMHAVGVLAIAPFLPRLATKINARWLMIAALALSATTLALFPLAPSVWLWFPLRLGLGVAAEILFVLSETWTNELVDDRVRGRAMAIYTAALSLGFAGGPAILSLVGAGSLAYLVGAAIAAVAILPLANPWLITPEKAHPARLNLLHYLVAAPVVVATSLLNAAVETAGLSFIALYAAGMGWSEKSALRLVSTLMVGAIVLQLPIGWLSDRISPRKLVLSLVVLSTVGALAWPSMLAIPWLAFGAIFLWGGVFVGIYTVMLTIVGSRYSGADLVGVYAVMSLAWGGGALLGPSLAGASMHLSPHYGLPYFVAAACATFGVFMATRKDDAPARD